MRANVMRNTAAGFAVAVVVFGVGALVAYGATATHEAREAAQQSLPSFRIIERNMGSESAVVSVAMRKLNATVAKQVAKYLVEEQLANTRKEARIFFYPEGAKVARDEPQHEISWAARRGYTLEY